MSLKNLTDDQIAAFRKDPVDFLRVEKNYESVFERPISSVNEKAAAALQNLGKPSDEFTYKKEETK